RPMVTPSARIIHHGASSEPSLAERQIKLLEAKVRLMRLHWSKLQAQCGPYLIALGVLVRAVSYSLLALCVRRLEPRASDWQVVWRRRHEWMLRTRGRQETLEVGRSVEVDEDELSAQGSLRPRCRLFGLSFSALSMPEVLDAC